MRGFLVGSLSLIVLYVLVQPAAANKAGQASNTLTNLFERALSPKVAGVPNRATNPGTPTGQGGQGAGGGRSELRDNPNPPVPPGSGTISL